MNAKAQTSLEFMVMLAPILIVFMVTIFIYSEHTAEASQYRKMMEANSICLAASSAIGSLASLPGNSSYQLNLPKYLDGQNYTVWVAANARLVKVNYGNSGLGCRLPALNITNSAGVAMFGLQKNATIRSYSGVIVVEP